MIIEMDLLRIAQSISQDGHTILAARKKRPSYDDFPQSEYSCNLDISLTVDFEGDTDKKRLIKKLQDELFAAIRQATQITGRELGLNVSGISVRPLEASVAITDSASSDEVEEDDQPKKKRRRK